MSVRCVFDARDRFQKISSGFCSSSFALRNVAQPLRLYFIKERAIQILRNVPQPDPAQRPLIEPRNEPGVRCEFDVSSM